CCCIGCEVRITCTGTEDNNTTFFEVAYSSTADIRFGNLLHTDGGHKACLYTFTLECILQSHAIDHRSEHAHIIGLNTIHSSCCTFYTTEDITTADNDSNFVALIVYMLNFAGITLENDAIYTVTLLAEQ